MPRRRGGGRGRVVGPDESNEPRAIRWPSTMGAAAAACSRSTGALEQQGRSTRCSATTACPERPACPKPAGGVALRQPACSARGASLCPRGAPTTAAAGGSCSHTATADAVRTGGASGYGSYTGLRGPAAPPRRRVGGREVGISRGQGAGQSSIESTALGDFSDPSVPRRRGSMRHSAQRTAAHSAQRTAVQQAPAQPQAGGGRPRQGTRAGQQPRPAAA
jgi:hypothetical protein